jgi:hypothetical protein
VYRGKTPVSFADRTCSIFCLLSMLSIAPQLRGMAEKERRRSVILFFFSNGSTVPWKPRTPHFSRLHDHTF